MKDYLLVGGLCSRRHGAVRCSLHQDSSPEASAPSREVTAMLDTRLKDILRCPESAAPLIEIGDFLTTADDKYRYPVIEGIPCLISASAKSTHSGFDEIMVQNSQPPEVDLDSFMDGMIVPTCGNLFRGVRLRDRYPIPDFPSELPSDLTLDVGCNWGRWSIAGAQAGHKMIGVDIHLEGLLVAQRLARKLVPDNVPMFVLADARHLPFADGVFDNVFSYSVVQHFSRENAALILEDVSRVLRSGGLTMIQMPNRGGVKARVTMPRRRFSDGEAFDVRYYSIPELIHLCSQKIGKSDWSVDCFLGLNVHRKDLALVPRSRRWVVHTAEAMLAASQTLPSFGRLADSVWIKAHKT